MGTYLANKWWRTSSMSPERPLSFHLHTNGAFPFKYLYLPIFNITYILYLTNYSTLTAASAYLKALRSSVRQTRTGYNETERLSRLVLHVEQREEQSVKKTTTTTLQCKRIRRIQVSTTTAERHISNRCCLATWRCVSRIRHAKLSLSLLYCMFVAAATVEFVMFMHLCCWL